MVTRVKGSTFRTFDNGSYISTADMGPQNTDITAEIIAALAAGTPIYISAGTWLFTSFTVPTNGIIVGMGEKSVLKQKDLTNSVGITVGSNCLLQNFLYDGNKANQVGSAFHAFVFNGSVETQAIQLYAQNVKGTSYKITNASSEVSLIHCGTVGHAEHGILIDSATNCSLISPRVLNSDVAATGDGIAISSNGAAVSNIVLQNPIVRVQAGRGIALVGNGAKNVTSVNVASPRVANNTNTGIILSNVDSCVVSNGISNNNGVDGVRLEGDVQNCRIIGVTSNSNTQFGVREVAAGTTPNLNGLIYNISTLNGTNVITKVGAASYVV